MDALNLHKRRGIAQGTEVRGAVCAIAGPPDGRRQCCASGVPVRNGYGRDVSSNCLIFLAGDGDFVSADLGGRDATSSIVTAPSC